MYVDIYSVDKYVLLPFCLYIIHSHDELCRLHSVKCYLTKEPVCVISYNVKCVM